MGVLRMPGGKFNVFAAEAAVINRNIVTVSGQNLTSSRDYLFNQIINWNLLKTHKSTYVLNVLEQDLDRTGW